MTLYSKEIMEHFKNPKNVGRMKNPSGLGQAGNKICGDIMYLYLKIGKNKAGKEIIKDVKFETFGCLAPNEKILTGEGDWQKISLIQKGLDVLNSNGRKTQVVKTFIRPYSGPILTITPFTSPFNKFSVTPEHPILSVKRNWLKSARRSSRLCNWLRIKEEELTSTKPRYVLAGNLKKSDYLIFTQNKKIKDSTIFNKDMMKLLGYYLAEGYSSANSSTLAFAFNKNEKENISELKLSLFKITNKKPKERIRKNVNEIYICSRKWVKFFTSIASRLAPSKKLSNEILLLPFAKQWEMIKTYIKGDGYLVRRRPNNEITYRVSTVSQNLAIQTQEILARGGIFSAIKQDTNIERKSHIEGRKVDSKVLYTVSFQLKRKHKFVHQNRGYFLVPIRKITKRNYLGNVYNIQVKNKPSSYLVKGFAVHNCTVAIANTSLLTTMVKRKTLEAAAKITKDDLIKKFGQVPLIKIHCSLLAVDALSEAIYDYFLKNKREISEELQKKHERIVKEKEEISHRHQALVELEEKLHKNEK